MWISIFTLTKISLWFIMHPIHLCEFTIFTLNIILFCTQWLNLYWWPTSSALRMFTTVPRSMSTKPFDIFNYVVESLYMWIYIFTLTLIILSLQNILYICLNKYFYFEYNHIIFTHSKLSLEPTGNISLLCMYVTNKIWIWIWIWIYVNDWSIFTYTLI